MGTDKILHGDLSSAIIGAAMTVLNKPMPGPDEKARENVLGVAPRKRGFKIEQQRRFDVLDHGVEVPTFEPDLLVNDLAIVDPEVCENFTDPHIAQMTGYLHLTDPWLALLPNFTHVDLGWKRVVL